MRKTLINLGFNKTEALIYLYLTREGPKKPSEIAVALRLRRQQIYKTLSEMQEKGVIRNLCQPSDTLLALPFEKILDLFIKANIEEAKQMIQDKDGLVSSWRSLIKKYEENGRS